MYGALFWPLFGALNGVLFEILLFGLLFEVLFGTVFRVLMGELYGASFVLLCVLLCGVTVESRGGDIMMTEVGLLEFELELELFCSLIIFNGFIGRIFPA